MADRIDSKAFQSMITSADADVTGANLFPAEENTWSQDMHTALAAGGMLPGIGNAADLIDAALYGLEGDKYGMGLSLISAIPAIGLISGGLKVKKGAELGSTLKKQTDMVEQAQGVAQAYGRSPLDSKLVSDIVDIGSDAAKGLQEGGRKMELLLSKGMSFEDALDVSMYYDSISKRGKIAAQGFKELGMTEAEIFGKEAVEKMAKSKERGMQLALEDAISGKYGLAKIFE